MKSPMTATSTAKTNSIWTKENVLKSYELKPNKKIAQIIISKLAITKSKFFMILFYNDEFLQCFENIKE